MAKWINHNEKDKIKKTVKTCQTAAQVTTLHH